MDQRTQNMIHVVEIAMKAAVEMHNLEQIQRFEAWRLEKPKPGQTKKMFVPGIDSADVCAAFRDLFEQAYECMREVGRDPQPQNQN